MFDPQYGVLSDSHMIMYSQTVHPLVSPFDERNVRPNSIDVRLGRYIKVSQPYESFVYDMRQYQTDNLNYTILDLWEQDVIMEPKTFCLGMTLETIYVPDDLTCTFEGRSGIGRIGLFVMNAGRVDSGWEGNLTCELFNAESFSIRLFDGMPIGQVVYTTVVGAVRRPYGKAYGSKYQGDTTPEPSKMWKDFQ